MSRDRGTFLTRIFWGKRFYSQPPMHERKCRPNLFRLNIFRKAGNFLALWLYNLENESCESESLPNDQIVAKVLAGNKCEFRKLVEQHHRSIFRFARNLVGNQHDAEDIAQDVFISAFDHLATFDAGRASMQTWLLTITRNRCLNYLKRKRPHVGVDAATNAQLEKRNNDSVRNEFWRRLDLALDELPTEQKTAFVLAEIEDLSYADIAQIEQTNLGTVKSRIHRAKQRLRAVMAPTLGEQ